MEAAGFPEEQLDEARAAGELAESFDVWPENWRAVITFVALGTQWRTGAMGQIVGLDYVAVEAAFRLRRVPPYKWRGLFAALQLMEAAALDYWHKKAESEK
jgi:hypothetical protein